MGTIGFVAGGAEKWLVDNPAIKIPERGTLLMIFGALGVIAAGSTALMNFIRSQQQPPP